MSVIIESLKASPEFTSKRLEGEDELVGWYCVLNTGVISIGLTNSGVWAIEGRDGLIVLNADENYHYVISLLEKSFSEVVTNLRKSEVDVGLDAYEGFVEVFPFSKIVFAGLNQESDYWAKLAFDWYEELVDFDVEAFSDLFIKIMESRWASQKIKHKAKAALKKLAEVKNRLEAGA